jgi:hypothetical protein
MLPLSNRIKNSFLLFLIFLSGLTAGAQEIDYAHFIVNKLSASNMEGRGYVNYGSHQAAEFIAREMLNCGIRPFKDTYSQPFHLSVNTFPGALMAKIDGRSLKPGADYLISASSPAVNQVFELTFPEKKVFSDQAKLQRFAEENLQHSMIAFDKSELKGYAAKVADSMLATNFLGAGGYLLINNENKLVWSVWPGEVQKSFPVVEVREDALPRKPKNLALTIEAEYNQNMEVKNILGFIPGTTAADTFLVFTAHYDHLGRMGSETYFPGANDNASGIAMMLDLARYFSKSANQQKYSIAFIALAGEELGLKGSTYFVENPFFPLENIRFLINLDMVGTGSEGITVVNGTIYPEAFALLDSINGANNYLVNVASRGESCNSDHCPFYQKGVPSVFIYSRGKEYLEYHNIYDLPQNLPFTEYDDIFRLLRDFIKIY